MYQVTDLLPWEMISKIAKSYLLNVRKMKLGTNKLKIDFKILPKIFFDATISTAKTTSEINADLAQNDK